MSSETENKICTSSYYSSLRTCHDINSSIPYPCPWQPWNVCVEICSPILTCPHFCELPFSRQKKHVPANFIYVPANISSFPANFHFFPPFLIAYYYHIHWPTPLLLLLIYLTINNIICPRLLHHQIASFIKNAKENIVRLQILP